MALDLEAGRDIIRKPGVSFTRGERKWALFSLNDFRFRWGSYQWHCPDVIGLRSFLGSWWQGPDLGPQKIPLHRKALRRASGNTQFNCVECALHFRNKCRYVIRSRFMFMKTFRLFPRLLWCAWQPVNSTLAGSEVEVSPPAAVESPEEAVENFLGTLSRTTTSSQAPRTTTSRYTFVSVLLYICI